MERLNELFPQSIKFNLKQIKEDLYFPAITLDKYIQVSNRIGNIDELLSSGNLEIICRIAFNFLDFETAKMFSSQEIKYIDDETGEIKREKYSGYHLLMRLIKDEEDVLTLSKAILKAIGYKNEDIEKMFNDAQENINHSSDSKKKATIGE